jgi:hypothetical protein
LWKRGAQIPRQQAIGVDVQHFLCDGREPRIEVVGRLDHDDLFGRQVDAEIAEQVDADRLTPPGGQHDGDAAHPDSGAVAHGDDRLAEALGGASDHAADEDVGVDRLARGRAGLGGREVMRDRTSHEIETLKPSASRCGCSAAAAAS